MQKRLFTLQESEDGRFWTSIRKIRTLKDCYLEIVSFEEWYPVEKKTHSFEWCVKDKTKKYFYRILDAGGGIMSKKTERFDPRTARE